MERMITLFLMALWEADLACWGSADHMTWNEAFTVYSVLTWGSPLPLGAAYNVTFNSQHRNGGYSASQTFIFPQYNFINKNSTLTFLNIN